MNLRLSAARKLTEDALHAAHERTPHTACCAPALPMLQQRAQRAERLLASASRARALVALPGVRGALKVLLRRAKATKRAVALGMRAFVRVSVPRHLRLWHLLRARRVLVRVLVGREVGDDPVGVARDEKLVDGVPRLARRARP